MLYSEVLHRQFRLFFKNTTVVIESEYVPTPGAAPALSDLMRTSMRSTAVESVVTASIESK